MYKVFSVGDTKNGPWEIFWCPSAPVHFNDKVPYDGKTYSTRAAAYRRVKELNDRLEASKKKMRLSEAIAS